MNLCEEAILSSIKSTELKFYTNDKLADTKISSLASSSPCRDNTLETRLIVDQESCLRINVNKSKSSENSSDPPWKKKRTLSDVEYSPGFTEPLVPDKQVELEQDFSSDQERGKQVEKDIEYIEPVENIEPGVETVNISEPVLDYRSNISLESSDIREVSIESTQCYTTESNYLRTDEVPDGSEDIFDFSPTLPDLVSYSTTSFGNYCTKGCSWFPSGNKILVPCEDARFRIFDVEEGGEDIDPCGSIKETEMIYDYCWEGEGSRFLSTGRYQPIHLWDPTHEELVATYKCFNHLDEIAHSFSLCMIPSGGKFLTGLKNQVRTYDLSRPGRDCDINVTGNKSGEGLVGIISSLSVNSDMNMYAAGSYSKTVGLYSLTGSRICLLAGHKGGVTQVSFSPDNRRLYSGARKDDEILCWDIRNPGHLLYSLQREVSTNQKIGFDFAGDHIVSGGTDGSIRIWDSLGEIVSGYLLHPDSVPGLSVHPTLPLIATSSGQRHSDPKSTFDDVDIIIENSLKIWNFSKKRCGKL